MRLAYKIFVIIAVVIVLATAGIVLGFRYLNSAPPHPTSASFLRIRVREGAGVSSVAQQLTNMELIRSPFFFRLLAHFNHLGLSMKAGLYRLAPGQTSLELVTLLEQGQPEEVFRVTLPEGWTSRKMAIKLEEEGITNAKDFLSATRSPALLAEFGIAAASAEGYLFPDTYYWPKDFGATSVVRMMLSNFFRRIEGLGMDTLPRGEKLHQQVILASILEKEYKVAAEAPLIASVFYNRLQRGQRLESCATVLYVITEELGRPHPTRIFFRDLEVRSPYNTYLHRGLPPGPISNPGLIAIQATMKPKQTDYLFFVVKDPAQGTHTFTSSLKDHNQARARYLENFLR